MNAAIIDKLNGEYEKYANKEVEEVWYVLFCLSENMFTSPTIGRGRKGVFVYGHEMFTSSLNSLETINYCLGRHFYADAYTLLRKVRDNLLLSLFIMANALRMGFVDGEKLKEDEDNLLRSTKLKSVPQDIREKAEVYATEAWLSNDLAGESGFSYRKNFFDYKPYVDWLRKNNTEVNELYEMFFEGDSPLIDFEVVERNLNNYVHNNGRKFAEENYAQLDVALCEKDFLKTMRDVITVFLSFLAIIDSSKLRSSDYLDKLEMGYEPDEDDLYYLAPCIYDFMQENFDKHLLEYIQDHQKFQMHIIEAD